MSVHRISRRTLRSASLVVYSVLLPITAFAAPAGAGGLPWESPLSKIMESFQSIAPVIATIAFIIAGATWMLGQSGGLSSKAVSIIAGGSVLFGAASLGTQLFEGASGLLF